MPAAVAEGAADDLVAEADVGDDAVVGGHPFEYASISGPGA